MSAEPDDPRQQWVSQKHTTVSDLVREVHDLVGSHSVVVEGLVKTLTTTGLRLYGLWLSRGTRERRKEQVVVLVPGIEPLIGGTPLVRVDRLFPSPGPRIYLKMEQFNPGGSVKDRTALGMLRAEERVGGLRTGMTIVESSSGNTAIGLTMLAKERGYRVVAICDRHLPAGKRARLRALGAVTVFLPETPVGMDTVRLRIAVADDLARRSPDIVTLGQYSHPGNPQIHRETTGPEIWHELDGDVAAVVAAVGTCGTISGVGQFLRSVDPSVTVVGVEPEGSVVFGGEPGMYLVQGGGLDFVPSIFDPTVIDLGLKIPDAEAFAAVHAAARREGWMFGGTAGLVVAGLARIRSRFGPGDTLVGIVPDGGDRYIETLYEPSWLARHGFDASEPAEPLDGELMAGVRNLLCSLDGFSRSPDDEGKDMRELCERLGAAPALHGAVGGG
jgi:cysteine synthase